MSTKLRKSLKRHFIKTYLLMMFVPLLLVAIAGFFFRSYISGGPFSSWPDVEPSIINNEAYLQIINTFNQEINNNPDILRSEDYFNQFEVCFIINNTWFHIRPTREWPSTYI